MNQFEQKENVLSGAVGAFLFSLAGGVIWYVLWQVEIIAAISGFVGVICAIKGYSVFAKGESVRGIVISTVMAAVVIVIAWYLCLSMDVYDAYQMWYANGEIDFTLTRAESVMNAYLFLQEPEIAGSYLGNLGLGMLFCVLGCVSPIRNALMRIKLAKAREMNPPVMEGDFEVETQPVETAPAAEETPAEETSEAASETEETDEVPH